MNDEILQELVNISDGLDRLEKEMANLNARKNELVFLLASEACMTEDMPKKTLKFEINDRVLSLQRRDYKKYTDEIELSLQREKKRHEDEIEKYVAVHKSNTNAIKVQAENEGKFMFEPKYYLKVEKA